MTRAVALLLTLMTGFTGLVYEVSWQKYLATLLGSHAEATVAVLAIFLGGLSMGYALFGRVSRGLARRRDDGNAAGRILRTYGVLECGIGLYAFLFPWLFAGWFFSGRLFVALLIEAPLHIVAPLPVGEGETGEDRLFASGLEYVVNGDSVVIDNVTFGSPAAEAGFDWDQTVERVMRPKAQPPKELMFIPALALLALIVLWQRSRARKNPRPKQATA